MKKVFLFLISSIICTYAVAQHYDGIRSYDIIGLADGNEIIECLIKGLPFLLIGLVLFLFNIKRSKIADKENKQEKGSWSGCLSLIFIGIAVLIMLPLLSWIEAIVVSIISVLAVLGVIILIWELIRK